MKKYVVEFIGTFFLVLTVGSSLHDDASCREFVDHLVEAGVSALGYGVGDVTEEIPSALLEECRHRGLPLLEVPLGVPFLRHIGIYAYRAGFLNRLAALPRTALEQAESLEQLRALEHGYAIAVRPTPEPFPPGIDTPEDLERAERWLAGQGV